MITALTLFAVTFVLVMLLGIQQLNVQFGQRLGAFVTSFAIAGLNLVLFKVMPKDTTLVQNIAYLLGGSFGILAGMSAHPWLNRHWFRARDYLRKYG